MNWDYTPLTVEPVLTIHVEGHAAAQGSKRYVGHRRNAKSGRMSPVLIEQSKRVKPWRALVTAATRAAMHEAGQTKPITGAVIVNTYITLPKPKSAPKRRRTYPTGRGTGDKEKLERAVFDGITDAGAIEDDSRIVDGRAIKAYPNEHPEALPEPGAIIRIWNLEEQ